jgi:cytochrome c biogenesis protein CcdA
MLLERLLTALVLGLSMERVLCCPFVAMSLSLSDRWAGMRFLLGRLVGICTLGTTISLVGLPFAISPLVLDIIFGVSLVAMGLVTLFQTSHKGRGRKLSHAGFALGLFRGMLNPGRKIAYLVPLLWGVSALEGMAVSLAYAVTSSVYLLIGFFSAEALNRMVPYQKAIRIGGGVFLVLLGIYFAARNYGRLG